MRKFVKDVVVGDILSLDVYHMDSRPHQVLKVHNTTGLWGTPMVYFTVNMEGEKFDTFSMEPDQMVSIWDKY